jgi:hypothetical protein
MSRIRRGLALTKKSWALLKEHRSLMSFPLVGGIVAIVLAVVLLGPGFYLIDDDKIAPGAPLVAIGLYLLSFVSVYVGVGLAAAVDMAFRGQEPTFSAGLAAARQRTPQIAAWALLTATVGLALRTLAERGGIVGAIVGRLLQIGWSLVTFLAVPVIAFEGPGAFDALKRSGQLFRERWGQQVTGNVVIGGVVALVGFLPAIALVIAGFALWTSSGFAGALLILLGVIVFVIAALISQALSGIFGVALYRYALDGEAVGGFTATELESAVRTKGAPAAGTI